jgi:hypothetical protein
MRGGNSMIPARSYTTVPALAAQMAVSQHSILGWIDRGELKAINVARRAGGRPSWRISAAALEAFENSRSAQPQPKITRTRRRTPQEVVEFY